MKFDFKPENGCIFTIWLHHEDTAKLSQYINAKLKSTKGNLRHSIFPLIPEEISLDQKFRVK